jgi:ribosomal protein S18 acetylase RimI-like enzyme
MAALFLRERSDYSHRHVHFITVDGRIAGMICCVSDDSSRENAFRTALFQLRFLFWQLPAIFIRCHPLRFVLEFVNKAHEGHFYIPFLAIHPEFRRRGLARRLFGIAETKARDERCTILSLCTDPTDLVALEFYRSCGMQESERSPTGRFRDHDGPSFGWKNR